MAEWLRIVLRFVGWLIIVDALYAILETLKKLCEIERWKQ